MIQVLWMRGWWPLAILTLFWGVLVQVRETGRDLLDQPKREGELRGIWFFRSRPTDWDALMQELQQAGLNSIFVRVGRGGNVIYPSQILPMDGWARELPDDELQRAIESAHRHGIAFHAWRVTFHLGSAPEEYRQQLAREDRLVRDSQGRQAHWANPADPRNFDTELAAFIELVEKYDVDGVHFDYIRYPEDPSYDFDYGEVSRRGFEAAIGRQVPDWPGDVINGPLRLLYEDWCRRQIDGLVEAVHREVKRRKPWVQVSAAVWRNHQVYSTAIKQNWPRWIEQGWLDFAVPMDYTPDAADFEQQVRVQVSLARGRAGMVIGIGCWLLKSTDDLLQQLATVRRYGADGFVLFSYNAEQIQEQLAALRAGPAAVPVEPAYRAPEWRVEVPAAYAWGDEPLRVIAGRSWDLTATVRPRAIAPEAVVRLAGHIRLEDGEGHLLSALGTLETSGEERVQMRALMPAGLFQCVLRGQQWLADGTQVPFVARGPLLLGISAQEYRAFRQRDRIPRPPRSGLRVAVWYDGWSADDLLDALQQMPGMTPFRLYYLRPSHLQNADALILPACRDLRVFWGGGASTALRAWTAEGHTLILCYDAVGVRFHPRLFPEVGRGLDRVDAQVLRSLILPAGMPVTFRPGHSNYARLKLTGNWKMWVAEDTPEATPVVAETTWGKGRLVLCGLLPGGGDGPVSPAEGRLLRALLTEDRGMRTKD